MGHDIVQKIVPVLDQDYKVGCEVSRRVSL